VLLKRDETIAAIATPPGRGAIAIVRVSGPATREIAARIFRGPRPLLARHATNGEIVDEDGARIDEGLALYFPAPHSYTGEDVLELHVHGSPAVARETLIAALAAGARLAGPGEFTRRAFFHGKIDLASAEAVADLIAAEHTAAARAAAARLSGGLAREVDTLRTSLDEILEELAAAIDFPDEVEMPPAVRLVERIGGVRARIAELAATWERGRIVREGVAVAIVGSPNAGKSSLLNALLGDERALVSELPGTTRDTIEETLALDGATFRLIDTAGIRAHADRLEAAGIERTERALDHARVALVVVDASVPLSRESRDLLVRTRERERVVLFNKSDLGRRGYDEREAPERDAVFGSTLDEATLDEVRCALSSLVATAETIDLSRPHLGTARQADALLEADRALAYAQETLAVDDPADLISADLMRAVRALGELTGREADERLLDAIFARFCIGK
jgi:tRNA modification GTPase